MEIAEAMLFVGPDQQGVASGVIKDVNVLSREVLIQLADDVLVIDVPVACLVLLNDERVKLRLLQAGDPVQVGFKKEGERAVAGTIHVQPPVHSG